MTVVPTGDVMPGGEAPAILDEIAPDVRLINLDTSITGRYATMIGCLRNRRISR